MSLPLIRPNWSAPPQVKALVTTRAGGVSQGEFGTLNLGVNTADDWVCVEANRSRLSQGADLPQMPFWLSQVHGSEVVNLDDLPDLMPKVDAAITSTPGRVCAVLTADCLPVFFCNVTGTQVAVAHGGWRGLAAGVLGRTVAAFDASPDQIMAWLGPGISQRNFEVGSEVRDAFVEQHNEAAACFDRNQRGRWQADLYALARQRLHRLGHKSITGGEFCTYDDSERFFSYRRTPDCGRMASLIWISP